MRLVREKNLIFPLVWACLVWPEKIFRVFTINRPARVLLQPCPSSLFHPEIGMHFLFNRYAVKFPPGITFRSHSIHDLSAQSQIGQYMKFVKFKCIAEPRNHFFVDSIHLSATRGRQSCFVMPPIGLCVFPRSRKVMQSRSLACRSESFTD